MKFFLWQIWNLIFPCEEEEATFVEETPKIKTVTPSTPMKDVTIIVSAGHGGIDGNGNYVTSPKSKGINGSNVGTKCFRHKNKGSIHSDGWVYEGVLNRDYANTLKVFAEEEGYKVVFVHDEVADTPLSLRVARANEIKGECIFLPIHFNASPNHKGNGFEAFTTKRENNSDKLAEQIYIQFMTLGKKMFPQLNVRTDVSDGDFDKEANFQEIRQVIHTNTYLELAFFDNEQDIDMILCQGFKIACCQCIINGVNNYLAAKELNR